MSADARDRALQRLEHALDATDDEIERLWEVNTPWWAAQEWDRLRARRQAIEQTIWRLER